MVASDNLSEGSSSKGMEKSSVKGCDDSRERQSVNLESFHLFALFPGEIQDLIWFHALPDPRVIELKLVQLHCVVSTRSSTDVAPRAKWYDAVSWIKFRSVLQRALQRLPRSDPDNAKFKYHYVDFHKYLEKRPTKPPELLFVCRDSRRVALNSLIQCTQPLSKEEVLATESRYIQSNYREVDSPYAFPRDSIPIKKLIPSPIWYNPHRDTVYLKESHLHRLPLENLRFRDIQSLAVARDLLERTPELIFGTDKTPALFPNIREIHFVYHKNLYKTMWREHRKGWVGDMLIGTGQDILRTKTNLGSCPDIKLITVRELLGKGVRERKATRPLMVVEPWVESYHHLSDFEDSVY